MCSWPLKILWPLFRGDSPGWETPGDSPKPFLLYLEQVSISWLWLRMRLSFLQKLSGGHPVPHCKGTLGWAQAWCPVLCGIWGQVLLCPPCQGHPSSLECCKDARRGVERAGTPRGWSLETLVQYRRCLPSSARIFKTTPNYILDLGRNSKFHWGLMLIQNFSRSCLKHSGCLKGACKT